MINLKNKSYFALTLILFAINLSVRVHSTASEEINTNSSTIARSRTKRFLIFQPGTRILFRINVKDNIIKNNQIFAHAFGFRANIDLLQPVRPSSHKVRRRDVYETLEELINQHGFDGRACILKTFCDASKDGTPQSGMLFKIFETVFTKRRLSHDNNSLPLNDENDFPDLTSSDCDELPRRCPLSLLEMTPYTDV